jgi:hypothetical protein
MFVVHVAHPNVCGGFATPCIASMPEKQQCKGHPVGLKSSCQAQLGNKDAACIRQMPNLIMFCLHKHH